MSKEVVVRNGKLTFELDRPIKTSVLAASPVAIGMGLGLAAGFIFAAPWIALLVTMVAMVAGVKFLQHKNPVDKLALQELAELEANPRWVDGRCPPQSEYDCENYDAVSFEKKLLSEGVIKYADMSLCDNAGCLLCNPLKKARDEEEKEAEEAARLERAREHEKTLKEARRRVYIQAKVRDAELLEQMTNDESKRIIEWNKDALNQPAWEDVRVTANLDYARISGGKLKAECQPCNRCEQYTWFYESCPKCRLERLVAQDENDRLAKIAAKKAKRVAARVEKKRLFEERRHVVLDGLELYRPDGVPEGAVPSLMHGRDIDPMATHSFIVWKWTEDGENTKFFKQPVVTDAYSVMSDHGHVKSWYSVTDDTGRYMGDYSTVDGKTEATHHDELMSRVGDIETWAWGDKKPERFNK